MAATRKTTVTHADGTVSTRGSKTRAYTHAVEIAPAPAATYAAWLTAQADRATAYATALRTAAVAGQLIIRSRGIGMADDMVNYSATLKGTGENTGNAIYTWSNAQGITEDLLRNRQHRPAVDYLRESALAMADHWDADAAKARREAAEVLIAGTPVGDYGIVRWSSSRALAAKGTGEFDYLAARGHAVRVVPVDAA